MKKVLLIAIALIFMAPSWAQPWSKDLEKNAKSGDIAAQVAVGNAYLNGDGVEKNLKKAAKWFYLAAKAGNKDAENTLLSFHSKELEKYAKEGNAEAQFCVGEFYYNGTDVEKNLKKAAQWYDMAVAQGHEKAKKNLGSFYSKQLANRVATEANLELQYYLGLCYLNGVEIAADKEKAANLFELSMNQGNRDAAKAFFTCGSMLTSNRIKAYPINSIVVYNGYLQAGNLAGWQEEKSLTAEIMILYPDGNENICKFITITGEKDGHNFQKANVHSDILGFSFNGNLEFELSDKDSNIISIINLKKGGELKLESQTLVLENDFPLCVTYDKNNSFKCFTLSEIGQSEPLTDNQENLPLSSKKVAFMLKNSKHATAVENVSKITSLDSVVCDLKGNLIVIPETFKLDFEYVFDEKSLENDQNLPDSISIEKDKFYVNGNSYVLKSKNNFDKIAWDKDYIMSFIKAYKDGAVYFHDINLKEQSKIEFIGKGKFSGKFHFGSLRADNNIKDFKYLKDEWNNESISSFYFVIVEGDYTDSKGVCEHWVKGRTENDYKKIVADYNKRMELAQAEFVAKLKTARENAKRTLISEGFNESDVNALLYQCTIEKGMPMRLIKRADELNANLKIELDVKIDGFPRQLVSIYNAENGELIFQKFIGYNRWGKVYIIEHL